MIDSEHKQKHAYLAVYVLSNSADPVDAPDVDKLNGQRRGSSASSGAAAAEPKRKKDKQSGSGSKRDSGGSVDLTDADAGCDLTMTSEDEVEDSIEDVDDGGLFDENHLQQPAAAVRHGSLEGLLNAGCEEDDMAKAIRLSMQE